MKRYKSKFEKITESKKIQNYLIDQYGSGTYEFLIGKGMKDYKNFIKFLKFIEYLLKDQAIDTKDYSDMKRMMLFPFLTEIDSFINNKSIGQFKR